MPINQFSNVMYSWQPAGTAKANTFTAQNIFKAASTTVPAFVAQATGTISAVPTLDANGIALFQGTEAVAGHVFFSASAATTHVVFRRNNGTYASPTAIASGDILGSLQWQGRGASTFGTVPAAQIRAVALQAFTEAARGTSLEFYTTLSGTITQQLTFAVEPALVYSLVALQGFASVRSNGNAGTVRDFRLSSAASARWALIANATAESGANAGSDFELRRYSDAGADLGAVLTINRASGQITVSNPIVTSSNIQISAAAGTTRDFFFRTSGSTRFTVSINATAESGSNAGSNFDIRRYSDAGADLGSALAIERANGVTTLNANKFNLTTAITGITASGSAGNTGDIAWDDTYLYVRMSTGWRRIALGAAF